MEKEAVLQRFRTQLPVRFVVDEGKWHFHAVLIDVDEANGIGKEHSINSIVRRRIYYVLAKLNSYDILKDLL